MTDLQFDNQTNEFGRPPEASNGFDITGKLINWGFVSNRKEAEYVLIGVAVVALLAAFFFYKSSAGSLPPPPPIGAAGQHLA
jgi:hypothetical protein